MSVTRARVILKTVIYRDPETNTHNSETNFVNLCQEKRWVYKRSTLQRKATYNCGLYYRRWTGTWSSLDIFYTNNVKEGEKKYDFPPVESAVANETARGMQKIQKQNDHMEENLQASTSTKNKRREKGSHQLFVYKSKKDDEVEVGDEKGEEEAGILEDFDYHDNINAESYEKYFAFLDKDS